MNSQKTFLKKILSFQNNKYTITKKAITLAHEISKSEHKPEKPIIFILSNLFSKEQEGETHTPNSNTT